MNSSHGELENVILNAVWDIEENYPEEVSVLDVKNKINEDNAQSWAYTTVKTVMDRLVDKNILRRTKQGKKFLYNAVYSREKLGRDSIEKLAKQYYNGDFLKLLKAVEKVCNEAMAFA